MVAGLAKHPAGRRATLFSLFFALITVTGCASTRLTAEPVYFPQPPPDARVVHLKSFNRLHALVPARPSLLEVLRGKALSPYVGTPAGVAFRDGSLYICDTAANVVHVWNLKTGEAERIGQSGAMVLGKPVAVAVDEGGTIYVADTRRCEVVAFDGRDGSPHRRFRPLEREHYTPVSVAVSGVTLYVADIAAHRIDVFSTRTGALLDSFGGVGSEPGRFYYPMGVAVGSTGDVIVSDTMNSRVSVLDARHKPVLTMGRPGNRYGDMGKPRHLAVGPDGVIFIADVEFAHVHLFNAGGELLMLLGGPDDRPGGTPMPVSLAIAETLPDRIAALVPDGFAAAYYLFVTNTIGTKRISLFAVGRRGIMRQR